MAEPHVVTALIKKRAELAGQIEHLQAQLRQTVVALDNVEATLRIFDPEIDLGQIAPRKVPTAHHAFRGEVSRIVLEALREATRPLSTTQLAEHVMRERGLDVNDKALCRVMSRRVGACLRNWGRQGAIRSMLGPGQVNLWEIVRYTSSSVSLSAKALVDLLAMAPRSIAF